MPSIGAVFRALRPRQWIKNLLVLAAPIAAGSLDEAATAGRALAAIGVFIAAAGTVYLVNDVADAAIDRVHPTKRTRPVAAGEISPAAATALAATLGVGAVVAASVLAWEFAVVIVAYLLINGAYSAGMKHVPGVELAAIAAGFVLRAVGGGAATDTPLSAWFVLVVCGAALFVVAGKRSAELARTGGEGGRRVLASYTIGGLRLTRAVSAALAVIAYALWVLDQNLANDVLAALSLLPFAAAIGRYSQVIEQGRGEDPEDVFLGDRPFLAATLCWVVVYGAGVYA